MLIWGNGANKLVFLNLEEYAYCIGYLANSARHGVLIYTHANGKSGAWAGQGKLERPKGPIRPTMPESLRKIFSLSGDNRVSQSDFVARLVRHHAFDGKRDPTGKRYTFYIFPTNVDNVRSSFELSLREAFDRGFNA